MKKNRILLTSALPYANGPLHLGHMIEYVQTDIYSRFLKLLGRDAIYCCADDTHGTPIEVNATKQGKTPEEFVKIWHGEHVKDFRTFGINFDSYYTTNSPENKHYTEKIFNILKEKGYIYTKEIELTYCEHDKRFLPDRYVKGTCPRCGAQDQYGDVCEKCNATYGPIDLIEPYCVLCKNPPVRKSSLHYFFKLSAFSKKLEKWLTENDRLQPEIRNQILSWVHEGLEDWCISRDGPYFGFLIPGEESKYFYVWLDAPIGYIASTANYCKNSNCSADDIWQKKDTEIIHFIGKDIIYFHLLFWPAVLMGAGFNVPHNIVVHGFLTVNKEKMSKSRGTFITAREFSEAADPMLLRYYYAANLTHSMTDIDLDTMNMVEKINKELVANIANFVYRVLSFTNKNFDSKIKAVNNSALLEMCRNKAENVKNHLLSFDYREAIREILEISDLGNKYFQDNAPWKLIKEDRERAHAVVTDCVNIVKILAVLLKPIIPSYAEEVESQLNLKLKWDDMMENTENHSINEAKIILNRIEDIKLRQPGEKKAPAEEKSPFSMLNLRVAEVYSVSDHYKADKLYLINVNLGKEKRQIVAGIKPYYPDRNALIGKRIVVVSNLEHANLRGERSEGMLLAAETADGKVVEVLTAPIGSEPGDSVYIDGITPGEGKISFDTFMKVQIIIKGNKVLSGGKPLRTKTGELFTKAVSDGSVR